MSKTITVYTKPADAGYCAQCVATKKKLDSLRLEYTEENIYSEDNLDMFRRAEREGISSVPIVHVETEDADFIFGGYQPPRLQELVILFEQDR